MIVSYPTTSSSRATGSVTTSSVSPYQSGFMYVGEVKTKDEEIADKMRRLMKFRDLKIVSIKDLGDGVEITLSRKRKYFKIKINGQLILEDIKGEELDELGSLPVGNKIWDNPVWETNQQWTYTTDNTASATNLILEEKIESTSENS